MSNIRTYESGIPGVHYRVNDSPKEIWEADISVIYGGFVVYSWFDGMNRDCPEDLVWLRELRKIFEAGVKLGMEIYKDQGS